MKATDVITHCNQIFEGTDWFLGKSHDDQQAYLASRNTSKFAKGRTHAMLVHAHHDELVDIIAHNAHEEWRNNWKKNNGDAPRMKTTKDTEWIQANGGVTEVDLASTEYADLPRDWQHENEQSALAVTTAIRDQLSKGGSPSDPDFIDAAASQVHDEWLDRNGEWAPEHQKGSFEELSKEEQDKDRVFVQNALKHLDKLQGGS